MAVKHNPFFSLVFLVTATILLGRKCNGQFQDFKMPSGGAVSNICSDSDFPKLCQEMTKGAKDPRAATQMAVQALIMRASRAKVTAQKLIPGTKGIEKSSLKTCIDVYADAISNLETSLDNIRTGDKGALKSNLSAVVADIGACEESMLEINENDLLFKPNKVMQKLGSNCLALAEELRFQP